MEVATLKEFLVRNWLKVLLGVVFLFVLLQKDLSFQLNLRAPVQSRKKVPAEFALQGNLDPALLEMPPAVVPHPLQVKIRRNDNISSVNVFTLIE